jgi:hypothetical protein
MSDDAPRQESAHAPSMGNRSPSPLSRNFVVPGLLGRMPGTGRDVSGREHRPRPSCMRQAENLAQPFGSELRRTAIVTCGPCDGWPRGQRIAADANRLKPRGGRLIESVSVGQSG